MILKKAESIIVVVHTKIDFCHDKNHLKIVISINIAFIANMTFIRFEIATYLCHK